MATTIKKGLNFVKISDVDYQLSKVAIELNDTKETLTLRFNSELKINEIKYDQLINGDTSAVFASYAALKSYVQTIITPEGTIRQIITQAAQLVNPAATTTENIVFTATIPKGSLGPTGRLEFRFVCTWSTSANSKLPRLKINGTTIAAASRTTSTMGNWVCELRNRAANSQITPGSTTGVLSNGYGFYTDSIVTYSFDTTQDMTLTFTLQTSNAADTMALEYLTVVAVY